MRTGRNRGMTLIEIMVVLVILGALMAIVIPSIDGSLARARIGTAKAQMANLGNAVQQYRLERKRLPPTLETLTEVDPQVGEPYIPHVPEDPWGSPYEYRILSRKEYEIRSYGDDMEPDTADDLRHPVYLDDE